jgi:hypothetical protein
MLTNKKHKIKNTLKFLSQHKTCNEGEKNQNINFKKLKQEAKAKNKSTKLNKESSNHENNLVTFSYFGN